MTNKNTRVIIVNYDPMTLSLQITIPPLRPFGLEEIDDYFSDIIQEVNSELKDDDVIDSVTILLQAFKDTIDANNINPLMEYFETQTFTNIEEREVYMLYDAIQEYIENARIPDIFLN